MTELSEPLTLGDGNPKPAGTWDYTSSNTDSSQWASTYTAAIFQWVAKSQRNATKKNPAVFRFKSNVGHPEAENAAKACCEELNDGLTTAEKMFSNGDFKDKRSMFVKPNHSVRHFYSVSAIGSLSSHPVYLRTELGPDDESN